MLKKIGTMALLLGALNSVVFAAQITFKSMEDGVLGLDGTYVLTKKSQDVWSTTDGKLVFTKENRKKLDSFRPGASVFEEVDVMNWNGKTYKLHVVTMTEKDKTAIGVYKVFLGEKLENFGTITYGGDAIA